MIVWVLSVMDPSLQDSCGFEEVQPLQQPHDQLQDVHKHTGGQQSRWIWWAGFGGACEDQQVHKQV